jgi:hypothetical protein
MSDDYFTRLERQFAQLTMAGAHLEPPRRWSVPRCSALLHVARRTVVIVSLVTVLAVVLVIEFPGSATGSMHRRGGLVIAAVARPDQGAGAILARRIGLGDA